MKIVDIEENETVEEYIERTYIAPPDLYFIAAKLPKSGQPSVSDNEEKG